MRAFLHKWLPYLGVVLLVFAVFSSLNSNTSEGTMLQSIAFGVAAIACFRGRQEFKD